ncbi:16S rRNA (cytosine(967)-C(5))-methyltransferase RsmB [Marinobacteraceae bacterium S3BR75-40.1]
MSADNLAQQAVALLTRVADQGESLSQILPPVVADLEPAERGRLQDWCFGTCRWWFRLQAELQQRLRQPLSGRKRPAHILLLLALYQLRHTERPPHAILNEAVDTCRQLRLDHLTGVVNGVLRSAQREGEPHFDQPAAVTAHPDWIVDKLRGNWPADWGSILAANNGHPPMTVRVNARQCDRETYLQQLQEAGIEARACRFAPQAITLAQPVAVDRLPGFAEGRVSVQDEAAQLCTELLDLAPGQRVLDACAAPGGKTAAMLERQSDLAAVTALDVEPRRLERVRENLERLQLKAEVVTGNALDPDAWWDGQPYDRILVDAPCSASGVIRRHPDIKLLRRAEDIKPLADTQLAMLETLWPLLQPGGRLLYATCSVFPQENQRIVERFLKQTGDARKQPLDVPWGQDTGFGRQLLPSDGGPDGFFYACLEKTE